MPTNPEGRTSRRTSRAESTAAGAGPRATSQPSNPKRTAEGGWALTGSVNRRVPANVQAMLWGMAAGRCELAGCNKLLWRSPLTGETRYMAEKAHIRAFHQLGPRGGGLPPKFGIHDLSNLMLLCGECHKVIDRGDGPERYTVDLLRTWKVEHERRVELATAIAPEMQSHVVTYTTSVGQHDALPTLADARLALLPLRYAAPDLIALESRNGARPDGHAEFLERERADLCARFERQVRARLQDHSLEHLSVFALAPQPLLIQLGVLLGDITAVDIYQRHREPTSWAWPPPALTGEPLFRVIEPANTDGPPALVLSLSATITPDRVKRVLGPGISIWTVTVDSPARDLVHSRAVQQEFRSVLRALLDRIKALHGHTTALHVFPAMPASLAVELGRVRMPKADAPWHLYDEHQSQGGFVPAFTIDHQR